MTTTDKTAVAASADRLDDWSETEGAAPGTVFDLRAWKITLPEVDPVNGKAAEIQEDALACFAHPRWFYLDSESGAMVFKTPNHAATTQNSANARAELRQMARAGDRTIDVNSPRNNWAIATNPEAERFAAIGGKMAATLAVDWVSTSGNDAKFAAHAVVVGQIHGAGKMEPLKIFYRKLPNHQKGSLFWNYESHPADENDREDIPNDVWGSHKLTKADKEPSDGIALGEKFSYEVTVNSTIMEVIFTKSDGSKATIWHDLSKGHNAIPGDEGYSNDWMYFKAGAYNQCNLGKDGVWGPACQNRGQAAGDYAQVSFFDLKLE